MKSQEITYKKDIDEIINTAKLCYMSMVDGDTPYVLPFNFGYTDNAIWLHSGSTGRKHDILKKNPKVCLAMSNENELHYYDEHVACSYSYKFKSVIIEGKVEYVTDYDEKIKALDIIMGNYTDQQFKYNRPAVENVVVFKIPIEKISAKRRGHIK
jgi:nitroimidazol reductase NimA-like FMN-containing flavoprotein (pyridoxamine 5'-phosphate oxidase superfamily)